MKLEVQIELLKFCCAVFNILFLVLGLSVGGCGVWILFDRGSFLNVLSSDDLRVVAAGLLLSGGVVVAVSVIGCLGATNQNRLLLLVYIGCLIVLVLGQLFVTLVLLLNRDKIEQSLNAAVDQVIVEYGNSSNRVDKLLDNVQHYGNCCGKTGPSDWLKNIYIQSLNLSSPDVLPCSCFSSYHGSFNSSWCSELLNFTEPLFGRGNGTASEGCNQKLSDWLQENTVTILVMDISLILIQVLQIVIALHLYRAFGKKSALKRSNLLADHTPNDDLDYGEENYAYTEHDGGYVDFNNANAVGPNHPAYHPDGQNHY